MEEEGLCSIGTMPPSLQLSKLCILSLIGSLGNSVVEFQRVGCTALLTVSGLWENPENVTKFFKWAEKELGIQTKQDWYKVTCKELERLGGYALVQHFNSSMHNAMMSVYPDHEWLPWKFASGVPNGKC